MVLLDSKVCKPHWSQSGATRKGRAGMDFYHVLEMVGEGSFGRVYKGRKKFSGQVVALKFIPKVGRSDKDLVSLKREIHIMRGLQHPNVVLLLDSFETEREVVVVTEYAEGELFQILEDDGRLPEEQVRVIACQLVSALHYLHSHRILHRDMKPQNILLGKGGVVKLCDFGFARAMSISTLVLTSIKGTPLYMSPELVEEKPYDHTADLWSLGCILYELHTGAPPFYTNSIFHLVQLIVRDSVKWPDSMSKACTSFLKGLLTKDPQKRLSWPALLKHPFVSEGVFVLTDNSPDNPLTASPNPDVQALKQRQVKEKTVPRVGEGKLLRKAREQRERDRRSKQKQAVSSPTGGSSATCWSKAPERTAQEGRTTAADCTVASSRLDHEGQDSASHAPVPAVAPLSPEASAERQGQISRDYSKQFPSVEVGPRQELKQLQSAQYRLGSVKLDNESDGEQDADSDEEWQHFVQATEPDDGAFDVLVLLPRLKSRLLTTKAQLKDGVLREACRLCLPLRVLGNLLTRGVGGVAEDLGLPHFLLDLVEEIMRDQTLQEQPWCSAVLGDLLSALVAFWERDENWDIAKQRPEDHTKALTAILFHQDMAPVAPVAGAVVALLAHRGVRVEVCAEKLIAVMESTLTKPEKRCVPRGWGACDSFLALLFQAVSEDQVPARQFVETSLWRLLWHRVGSAVEDDSWDYLSLKGVHVFLALALFVFTREPPVCMPLFADRTSGCLRALGRLLPTDCTSMKDWSATEGPAHMWAGTSPGNLSVMSCHLLCFPFALEVPNEAMEEILCCYDDADIVSHLLQLCTTLPLTLLELPVSLLCRLLLCDPERSVPRFTATAQSLHFFHTSRSGRGQTATSLLLSLLQSEDLSASGAELLSALSQTARCLNRPPLARVHVDPPVLEVALGHADSRVRTAACSLLGNLTPLPQPPLLLVFHHLTILLRDPSLPVRRAACHAVGSWLAQLASGCHDDAWSGVARAAVPPLVSLLRERDPLVLRRCCAALGNLAGWEGGAEAFLQCDGPAQLLHTACSDLQPEEQLAALSALAAFSQQDVIIQALVSMEAAEKLVAQKDCGLPQYQRLLSRLQTPAPDPQPHRS